MRTETIKNRDWNKNSYNVKRWCFKYSDLDTGETVLVKGDTYVMYRGIENVTIFGNRNHPSLKSRRLRFEGISTVNVTGLNDAVVVPDGLSMAGTVRFCNLPVT